MEYIDWLEKYLNYINVCIKEKKRKAMCQFMVKFKNIDIDLNFKILRLNNKQKPFQSFSAGTFWFYLLQIHFAVFVHYKYCSK